MSKAISRRRRAAKKARSRVQSAWKRDVFNLLMSAAIRYREDLAMAAGAE